MPGGGLVARPLLEYQIPGPQIVNAYPLGRRELFLASAGEAPDAHGAGRVVDQPGTVKRPGPRRAEHIRVAQCLFEHVKERVNGGHHTAVTPRPCNMRISAAPIVAPPITSIQKYSDSWLTRTPYKPCRTAAGRRGRTLSATPAPGRTGQRPDRVRPPCRGLGPRRLSAPRTGPTGTRRAGPGSPPSWPSPPRPRTVLHRRRRGLPSGRIGPASTATRPFACGL